MTKGNKALGVHYMTQEMREKLNFLYINYYCAYLNCCCCGGKRNESYKIYLKQTCEKKFKLINTFKDFKEINFKTLFLFFCCKTNLSINRGVSGNGDGMSEKKGFSKT